MGSFAYLMGRKLADMNFRNSSNPLPSQSVFTCSKLTIETLEQSAKNVQS